MEHNRFAFIALEYEHPCDSTKLRRYILLDRRVNTLFAWALLPAILHDRFDVLCYDLLGFVVCLSNAVCEVRKNDLLSSR